MNKQQFYRGHCFIDKGRYAVGCPHIKGSRPKGVTQTMCCKYGEENCPYVKEEKDEDK